MEAPSPAVFSPADLLANLYAAQRVASDEGSEPLELDVQYCKLDKSQIIALAHELALARKVRAASSSANLKKVAPSSLPCLLSAIRAINAAGNEWDRELSRLFCHLVLAQILMFAAKPAACTTPRNSGWITPRRNKLDGEGLVVLELDNNTLSSDGIRCLAGYLVGEKEVAITQGEAIREMHLGTEKGRLVGGGLLYLQHPTEASLSQALRSHLGTIETLELAENQMMDVGCYCLSTLVPHCRALKKLSLVTNQLTGRSGVPQLTRALQQTALAGNPSFLTQLRLDYNDLGDAGAAVVAEVAATFLPSLQRLGLSDNSIGDEGAKAISKYILGNPQCPVEYLNLSVNKIGTPGFISIAEALCCRTVPAAARRALLETMIPLSGHEDDPNMRRSVFRSAQDIITSLGLKAGVNITSSESIHFAGTPVIAAAGTEVSTASPSVNPNLLDIDIACNEPTSAGRFYLAALASQFKYLLSLDVTSCNLNDEELDHLAFSIEEAAFHPLTCGIMRVEWYNNPQVKPETEQRLGVALDRLKTIIMASPRGGFIQEMSARRGAAAAHQASPPKAPPSTPIHPVTIATAVGTAITAIAVCFLIAKHRKNFQ